MEGQVEAVSVQQMEEPRFCGAESCHEGAVAEVDARPFCLDHFLGSSLAELKSRYARLQEEGFDSAGSFRESLAAWAKQAEALLEDERFADETTHARLLDALAWTSRAGKSLRRSPRVPTAIPVWLRREDPRRTWEEDTWTTTLSRHGAGFVCRHPVELGGTVTLTRKDKGGRAEARVVYSRLDADGRRQIGVELIDRDNFWD